MTPQSKSDVDKHDYNNTKLYEGPNLKRDTPGGQEGVQVMTLLQTWRKKLHLTTRARARLEER
jgi:hypothetical protein